MDDFPFIYRLTDLRKLVELNNLVAKKVQDSNVHSSRVLNSLFLLEKSRKHIESLLILIESKKDKLHEIDLSALCVLSRVIIETHNVSSYLCKQKLSSGEHEFRYLLYLLSAEMDDMKIYKELGFTNRELGMNLDEYYRNELNKNKYFQQLPEKQKIHFLEGRSPYNSLKDKVDRPIAPNIESAIYNLFSHSIHSFQLSIGVNKFMLADSVLCSAKNLIFLSIEISLIYGGTTLLKYTKMRHNALKTLTQKNKLDIESIIDTTNLNAWLDFHRNI